jgi:hypothetical protein
MTSDHGRPKPPLTTTYTSAPEEAQTIGGEPAVPPQPPRAGPSRNRMIAIGVVGAVALGVLLGVAMAPSFKEPAAEAEAPASDGGIQIQVTTRRAPAPKLAMNVGKIDAAGTVIQPTPAAIPAYAPRQAEPPKEHRGLLGSIAGIFGIGGDDDEPDERAEPAPAPAPRPAPVQARNDQVVVLDRPQPRQADEVAEPREVESASWREEPPPAPRAYVERPSFNCRYARSRAEQMVCEDPRLAAYDRRLARAFRRAVDNGAPFGRLRAQQDRWLAARERAAVSPEAVGMVYEQRIAELEDIGDRAGEEEGW